MEMKALNCGLSWEIWSILLLNRQQIEKNTAAVIERQLYQRGYATVEDSLILMGWLEEKYLTH